MDNCALVTGGAKRIGQRICLSLAEANNFVWIHYHHSEKEALALQNEIKQMGTGAGVVSADLSDIRQIDAMFDRIKTSGFQLDILVNNASDFYAKDLFSTTEKDWDYVMNVNLRAVWYCSKKFVEQLGPEKKAHIINIGDANANLGSLYKCHAVYGLSKFALNYLTLQMAESLPPSVSTSIISPGLALRGENEPVAIWKQRMSDTPGDMHTSPVSIAAKILDIIS